MKRPLNIYVLSFSLGLLLISFIAYAKQTSITNYYPSPSGNYTKLQLTGPTAACSSPGTIFANTTTGFMEICKNDGSIATYPGSCFNRLAASLPTAPELPCPTNYQMVNLNTNTIIGSATINSWSCCFTGQGAGTDVASNTNVANSGCFSIYSTTGATTYPASCYSQNQNSYDIGCDTIYSSDMTTPVYKRNCCFNDTVGSTLNAPASTCTCPNMCGTDNCETDACGHSCGSCPPVGSPTLTACSSSTAGIPGNCVCVPSNGTCTAWGACSSSACGVAGTQTCTASTAPTCGGTSAVGTTQACTGNTPVNGTCTAWGACSSSACGVAGTQSCTASTAPACGGTSAVGTTQACTGNTPVNGTCTAWGACSSSACGVAGTQTCSASTAPACGGTSAVGTTQACSGSSPVNGTCTAWGACSIACGVPGTQTCDASTAPACGGTSALGDIQACTGICSGTGACCTSSNTCSTLDACNVCGGLAGSSCAAGCGCTGDTCVAGGGTCTTGANCVSGSCVVSGSCYFCTSVAGTYINTICVSGGSVSYYSATDQTTPPPCVCGSVCTTCTYGNYGASCTTPLCGTCNPTYACGNITGKCSISGAPCTATAGTCSGTGACCAPSFTCSTTDACGVCGGTAGSSCSSGCCDNDACASAGGACTSGSNCSGGTCSGGCTPNGTSCGAETEGGNCKGVSNCSSCCNGYFVEDGFPVGGYSTCPQDDQPVYDVVCGTGASCTGSVPSNATSCNSIMPATNTAYSEVGSCASTPCTFACNSSYTWNGSSCAAGCGANCSNGIDTSHGVSLIPATTCGSTVTATCISGFTPEPGAGYPTYKCNNGTFAAVTGACSCITGGATCAGGTACCSFGQECQGGSGGCCTPATPNVCTPTYACGSTAGTDTCSDPCTATAGTCTAGYICVPPTGGTCQQATYPCLGPLPANSAACAAPANQLSTSPTTHFSLAYSSASSCPAGDNCFAYCNNGQMLGCDGTCDGTVADACGTCGGGVTCVTCNIGASDVYAGNLSATGTATNCPGNPPCTEQYSGPSYKCDLWACSGSPCGIQEEETGILSSTDVGSGSCPGSLSCFVSGSSCFGGECNICTPNGCVGPQGCSGSCSNGCVTITVGTTASQQCGGGSGCSGTMGCDGVCNSGKVDDACGVCGGTAGPTCTSGCCEGETCVIDSAQCTAGSNCIGGICRTSCSSPYQLDPNNVCCNPTAMDACGYCGGAVSSCTSGCCENDACTSNGSACTSGSNCSSGTCVCTPTTCAAQGSTCGTASDGCGGTLDCGGASDGINCGGALYQNYVCSGNQCICPSKSSEASYNYCSTICGALFPSWSTSCLYCGDGGGDGGCDPSTGSDIVACFDSSCECVCSQ